MSCERVRDESVAERYLTHQLTDVERDTFEAHFFECGKCFEELRTLQALQAELQRNAVPSRSSSSVVRWAAAAALVIATGTAVWLLTQQRPEPSPPGITRSTTPAPAVPVSAGAGPALDDLAVVQAPEYIPLTLRSAASAEAAAFDDAMVHYMKKEYAQAARLLEPIAGKTSAAALYLGVSRLMMDDSAGAITALEQSLAAGDPRLAGEARFLLGKAHLRAGRLDAARAELQRAASLGGGHAAEARTLLMELDKRGAR